MSTAIPLEDRAWRDQWETLNHFNAEAVERLHYPSLLNTGCNRG